MSWFYAQGGQQKGPVSDQELQALVQAGTITSATLVWREGMADWKPYASVAAPPPPPPPTGGGAPLESPLGMGAGDAAAAANTGPTAVCSECGRIVPAADTVALQGRAVCASCKPQVVQRMAEGAHIGGPRELDAEALLAALRSRGGYQIDVGSVVSRSFDVVKTHVWPSIGVTLLVLLMVGVAGVLPCAGMFISWGLTGAAMGGLNLYFLPKIRGQVSTINEAFGGFNSRYMKRLTFAGMVIGAPALAMNIFNFGLQMSVLALSNSTPQWAEALPFLMVAGVAVFGLLILIFTLIWNPAYAIIADTNLGFWEAMNLSRKLVMQRIGSWIVLYLAIVGITILGFLALCVGVFFVMPMMYVMHAMVWDDIRRRGEEAMAWNASTSA